jgi:hypothetical protein
VNLGAGTSFTTFFFSFDLSGKQRVAEYDPFSPNFVENETPLSLTASPKLSSKIEDGIYYNLL